MSTRSNVPISPRSAASQQQAPPPIYQELSEEDQFKQIALRNYEKQQLENAQLLEAMREKKRQEEERKARGEPEPTPPPIASPKAPEVVLSPRTKKEKEEAKKKEKEEKERLKREEKEREKKQKEDRVSCVTLSLCLLPHCLLVEGEKEVSVCL